MIVGAAQVVLNVSDLDSARAAMQSEPGMRETFAALDLANNPVKAPFQRTPRDRLAMVHFAREGRLAIELTAYEGAPPAGVAAYGFDRDGDVPIARLAAADPEASRSFWTRGLRFKEGAEGRLSAPAMHPAWRLDLDLADAAESGAGRTTVDADGCVLITLLSTGIERDLETLAATGLLLRSTAPWRERVADRQTHVAFVEGPSGELVELLEAPRPGSG